MHGLNRITVLALCLVSTASPGRPGPGERCGIYFSAIEASGGGGSLRRALLAELRRNPQEAATLRALADLETDAGNPQGELIAVALELATKEVLPQRRLVLEAREGELRAQIEAPLRQAGVTGFHYHLGVVVGIEAPRKTLETEGVAIAAACPLLERVVAAGTEWTARKQAALTAIAAALPAKIPVSGYGEWERGFEDPAPAGELPRIERARLAVMHIGEKQRLREEHPLALWPTMDRNLALWLTMESADLNVQARFPNPGLQGIDGVAIGVFAPDGVLHAVLLTDAAGTIRVPAALMYSGSVLRVLGR